MTLPNLHYTASRALRARAFVEQNPSLTVKELRRAMAHLGLASVSATTHQVTLTFDDKSTLTAETPNPIFEAYKVWTKAPTKSAPGRKS
jgi:hypothetical protein